MSDSENATPSVADSDASVPTFTPSTAYDGTEGIFFVNAGIFRKELPEPALNEWYVSHFNDMLTCPGNGGLALRYINLHPPPSVYSDPGIHSRFTIPASSPKHRELIAAFPWKYLALVRIDDLAWTRSPEFLALPLTSEVFPRNEDGSLGNGLEWFFAALRGYAKMQKTVKTGREASNAGRAKYLVTVQLDTLEDEVLKQLNEHYGAKESCRSTAVWKIAEGILQWAEPGWMPVGLLMYEFDGGQGPELVTPEGFGEKLAGHVVRQDAWEIIVEAGDKNLEL